MPLSPVRRSHLPRHFGTCPVQLTCTPSQQDAWALFVSFLFTSSQSPGPVGSASKQSSSARDLQTRPSHPCPTLILSSVLPQHIPTCFLYCLFRPLKSILPRTAQVIYLEHGPNDASCFKLEWLSYILKEKESHAFPSPTPPQGSGLTHLCWYHHLPPLDSQQRPVSPRHPPRCPSPHCCFAWNSSSLTCVDSTSFIPVSTCHLLLPATCSGRPGSPLTPLIPPRKSIMFCLALVMSCYFLTSVPIFSLAASFPH